MKKNKIIEQKLNKFAQSVILDPNTVNDAAIELSLPKKSNKLSKWLVPSLASVCIIIAITLFTMFFTPYKNAQNKVIEPYSLNSLQQTAVANIDYHAALFSQLDNAEYQQKAYTANGETKVIATEILSVTQNGTSQITVYLDIGGGLINFIDYNSYEKQNLGGQTYTSKTNYKDGEYYFYIYYNNKGLDYYITIMSPYSDAAKYYLENI